MSLWGYAKTPHSPREPCGFQMSPLIGTAGHAPSHFVSSFQSLVRTGENNWSLPELVHAVVLLAHYHALASFVFGSGINPERDPEVSDGFRLISVNSFCGCDVANDNSIENSSLTDANFRVRTWVSGGLCTPAPQLEKICSFSGFVKPHQTLSWPQAQQKFLHTSPV